MADMEGVRGGNRLCYVGLTTGRPAIETTDRAFFVPEEFSPRGNAGGCFCTDLLIPALTPRPSRPVVKIEPGRSIKYTQLSLWCFTRILWRND